MYKNFVLIIALMCSLSGMSQSAIAHYRTTGSTVLNDLTITPGAVRPVTAKDLCNPAFHTASVRNVLESIKYAACAEYGISKSNCTGKTYEIDHLISLELGGSNDIKNLWPQPYAPKPGAKEKDTVENWLHRQVCSNAITLDEAQREISTDWYAVYLKLSQKDK